MTFYVCSHWWWLACHWDAARYESPNSVRVVIISIGTKLWQNHGVQILRNFKASCWANPRWPPPKITKLACPRFQFSNWIFVSIVRFLMAKMITGHGIHFEVIFEAHLNRKYLSFSPDWPSLLMFHRNWYQIYARVIFYVIATLYMVLPSVQHFK